MCSIPEDDYRKLKERANTFTWFIPEYKMRGGVFTFSTTAPVETQSTGDDTSKVQHVRVLYLSPTLEKAAWDIVVAIVAHELVQILAPEQDSLAHL